jgi:hypothetical protein
LLLAALQISVSQFRLPQCKNPHFDLSLQLKNYLRRSATLEKALLFLFFILLKFFPQHKTAGSSHLSNEELQESDSKVFHREEFCIFSKEKLSNSHGELKKKI